MNASRSTLSDRLGPSDHAVRNYRKHFKEADGTDLLEDVQAGTPLNYELVRSLTRRAAPNSAQYKLARVWKSPRVQRRNQQGTRRLKPEWVRDHLSDQQNPAAIYILSVHRRGIFVIDSETRGTVITYLRLSVEAMDVVKDL